ncbi:sensor histidine kinase [Cellulomonas wangsupingiae]|uniref:sensor histidine kinase n=1 Tax=Cellulomonas wangsupingiae TaxID=2968085 RepID=UPI001D0F07CE|nr:histidine kinase [Cellulomonas wangsupingiae]MCM0640930.1 histidine kinase [Cellulomonas wangsupingiae]
MRPTWPARTVVRDVPMLLGLWLIDLLVFFTAGMDTAPGWLVGALGLVTFVPLLWRRQAPVAAFAVTLVLSVTISVATAGYRPMVATWAGLYAVAASSRWAVTLGAVASTALPTVIIVAEEADAGAPGTTGVRTFVAITGVLAVDAVLVAAGRLQGRRGRELRDLQAQQAEKQREAVRLERARIARELHDIVARSITLMSLQAVAAARVLRDDPARAEQTLDRVGDLGASAVDELHRMLGLLDVAGADAAPDPRGTDAGTDVGAEVRAVVQSYRDAGLRVDLSIDGAERPVDESVRHAAARVLQESLTNATKHGDPDDPVVVRWGWSQDGLLLDVSNAAADGRAPQTGTGYGLVGLAERVRAVGGTLEAAFQGERFVVRAALPVRPGLDHRVVGAGTS